jgi:hypothetical protein
MRQRYMHSIFELDEQSLQKLKLRFWKKVKKRQLNGCWMWIGAKNRLKYGLIQITQHPPTAMSAHRVSYELLKSKIPFGLTIDHLCKNPSCVNPDHLETVTLKINILRGTSPSAKESKQTHCKRGHILVPENLLPSSIKNGKRECRICQSIRNKWRYCKPIKELTEVSP